MNSVKFSHKDVIPSKVICIGRNYVEHIYELQNEIPSSMVVFNKPNSAISKELKYFNDGVRFEGEICFLIENKKISGIGFGLDLTNATIQNYLKQKGLPWERAKAFDGSCVVGDFVSFDGNLEDLRFEMTINGVLQQFASYDLMIYKPQAMIEEIQTFMTLCDGDIIMSGTPKGVGGYKVGDIFEAKVFDKNELLVTAHFCAK